MSKKAMISVFTYVDDVVRAVEDLGHSGILDFETFGPIPSHDIEHAVMHLEELREKKPFLENAIDVVWRRRTFQVGRGTAVGAVLGVAAAWALFIGTKLMLSTQTGGMPVIPLPPMGLLSYEMGTLFATLGSLGAFLYLGRLPKSKLGNYDVLYSYDKFGILIESEDEEILKKGKEIVEKCGADSAEIMESKV